jgi:hypothetical protein
LKPYSAEAGIAPLSEAKHLGFVRVWHENTREMESLASQSLSAALQLCFAHNDKFFSVSTM